jgi:succinate dehydrogenase / fumarate reductase iron-sulfur subunit
MKLTLKIWRQKDSNDKGGIKTYSLDNVFGHMSFLEMMDVLNE